MSDRQRKILAGLLFVATEICSAQTGTLPAIRQNGAAKQLFVDGKPFIMLAGELHNSDASSADYMKPVWERLSDLHLNTVIGSASWELVEPTEGHFDFGPVDAQVAEARKRGMHLVLIWFATWKNAGSGYVPYWVKLDQKRFPRMVLRSPTGPPMIAYMAKQMSEQGISPLSPFSRSTLKADAAAFRALMEHLRAIDSQHTVVMMQVENEVGSLGDSRDRSPAAEAAWAKPVPPDLLNYLQQHRSTLLPELQEVWAKNGYKTSGTWGQVFGTNVWGDEVFMAYYMGSFIDEVARAGKSKLNIPMYVNAWLGPQPKEEVPGDWPSGGPVARVLDVYRAAAPAIDFVAPDIYVPNFKATSELYSRSGNPLFVPEARDQAGNLIWALGHEHALGWSVFGIEDLKADSQVAQAYKSLSGMLPQLAAWEAAGKVEAVLNTDSEHQDAISLGGYRITLRGGASAATESSQSELAGGISAGSRSLFDDKRAFAIVVSTGPDEFLFLGANGTPSFASESGPGRVVVTSRDEGRFQDGKWVSGRRLNGDELFGSGLPHNGIGFQKIKVMTVQ